MIWRKPFWRRRARVCLKFAAFFLPLLSACDGAPRTVRAAEVFGTRVTIIVSGESEERAAAAAGEVFAHFQKMHRRFHAWRDGELAEVNRAVAAGALPATVGAPMAAMISLSAEFARRGGGLFNPAAGELFALWGFHSDDPPREPPSRGEIADYLSAAPRMRDVELRGRVLRRAPPRTRFDFGGVAKGAALDAARDIMRRRGIGGALINVGGDILAVGDDGGRPWRIFLHPAGVFTELADGEAASTSGGGARFFVREGRRYHHLLNPRTGAPSDAARAATAISGDPRHAGAISDAAATALAIAEESEARQIAKNFELSAALQVDKNGDIRPLLGAARWR
ncbi:MAG: FAD:protein FMN transferase [Gammaproteobacteria bacterium]